jgi:hypothetical protein
MPTCSIDADNSLVMSPDMDAAIKEADTTSAAFVTAAKPPRYRLPVP